MNGKQVILLIVALGSLAGAGFFYSRNSGTTTPSTRTGFSFVCVETGERVDLDIAEFRVIPGKNPKTNRNTLFPVTFDESSGKFFISKRYRGPLESEEYAELNKYVDLETFEVREN